MIYSKNFRENALKQIIPPANRSIREVSEELGIANQTLLNWKNKLDRGILSKLPEKVSPCMHNISERYSLIIESYKIKKKDKGRWLRENGLHSDHLKLWEKEFKYQLTTREKKFKNEIKILKADKKKLEKDLLRKDKALAEMAALVTLKKKAEIFWGELEE